MILSSGRSNAPPRFVSEGSEKPRTPGPNALRLLVSGERSLLGLGKKRTYPSVVIEQVERTVRTERRS